jgi:hypothetical protein
MAKTGQNVVNCPVMKNHFCALDLICVAKTCRDAFERADLSSAPGYLPQFPRFCCEWAASIIGYFLQDECKLHPIRICASRAVPDRQDAGHHWIEVNAIIIDITADQFPDQSEPVMVLKDSKWHQSWKIEEKESVFYAISELCYSWKKEKQLILIGIYNDFAFRTKKNCYCSMP